MPRLPFRLPPDVADRVKGFTGRGWALDRVEQWLSKSKEPLLVITAPPGVGKTALVARLVQIALGDAPQHGHVRENWVHAVHFCQQARFETVDAVSVLRSLSAQLCATVPGYAEHVIADVSKESHTFNVRQQAGVLANSTMIGVQVTIEPTSPQQAFLQLLRRPLTAMSGEGSLRADVMVIVDALDETVEGSADQMTLGRLLAIESADPVPGMRLLVTTRPGQTSDYFSSRKPLRLDDDEPADSDDVRGYISNRLGRMRWRVSSEQSLADRIAQASDGNFLYAALVLDDLKRQRRNPGELPGLALPRGLDGIYAGFLNREIAAQSQSWQEAFRPVLGVLVQSRGDGLTRDQLAQVTGLQRSKVDDIVATCVPYLRGQRPTGPFTPYHESFRDYLRGEGPHHIYPAEATWSIITGLAGRWLGKWESCTDQYVLRHILGHLRDAADPGTGHYHDALALLRDIASDPAFLEASLALRSIDDLLTDYGPGLTLLGASGGAPEVVRSVLASQRRQQPDARGGTSNTVLQLLRNRAKATGHDSVAARAEERLEQRGVPYAKLLWATNPSSGFETVGYHRGAKFLVTADSGERRVVLSCGFPPCLWDLDGELPEIKLSDFNRPMSAGAACQGTFQGKEIVAVAARNYIRIWGLDTRKTIGEPVRAPSDIAMNRGLRIAVGSCAGRDYAAFHLERKSMIVDTAAGFDWTRWQPIELGQPVTGMVFSTADHTDGRLYVAVQGGGLYALRNDGEWQAEQVAPAQAEHPQHLAAAVVKEVSGRPKAVFYNKRDGTLIVKDMISGGQTGRTITLGPHGIGETTRIISADIMETPTGELLLAMALEPQRTRLAQFIIVWDVRTGAMFSRTALASGEWIEGFALAMMRGLPVCLVLTFGQIRAYPLSRASARNIPELSEGANSKFEGEWVSAVGAGTWGGKPHVVSGHLDGSVAYWNLWTGEFEEQPASFVRDHTVRAAHVTVIDGNAVVITLPGRALDVVRDTSIQLFRDHPVHDWVECLAIGEMRGELIFAYGSSGGIIKARKLLTGELLEVNFAKHQARVSNIAVGQLGKETVILSNDGPVIRAEVIRTGRQRAKWRAGPQEITALFAGPVFRHPSIVYGQSNGMITIRKVNGAARLAFQVDAIPTALAVYSEDIMLVGTTTGIQTYQLRNLDSVAWTDT